MGSAVRSDRGRYDDWLVFLSAVALRLVYLVLLRSDDALFSVGSVDSESYLTRAAEIAAGRWSSQTSYHSASLYPYFLAALGSRVMWALVTQALIDAASAVLLCRIARRLGGRFAGLVAGTLYAACAVAVFASATILFDSIGVFLVVATVEVAVAALDRESSLLWAAAALLVGLAASARPFLALFPFVVLVGSALRGGLTWRMAARNTLWAGAGLALVIIPVGAGNRVTSGEFRVLPASGGLAFYMGNNPVADGTAVFPTHLGLRPGAADFVSSAMAYPARRLGRAVTTSEASAFWVREGFAFWLAQPGRAAILTVRKALMLFNVGEIPDNHDFMLTRERVVLLRWLPGWLPVLALAPWGIFVALRRRTGGVAVAMMAIHVVALPLFLATGRLRYALMAMLVPFAGVAAAELVSILKSPRRLGVVPPLFVVVISGTVALWPITTAGRLPSGPGLGQLASALTRAGRAEEALAVLESAAVEELPRIPDSIRGDALLASGRTVEALAAYRRGVEQDRLPDHPHQMIERIAASSPDLVELRLQQAAMLPGSRLAQVALAERCLAAARYDSAIRWAGAALQSGAGDDARHLLAAALLGRGRFAEALVLFDEMIARQPRSAILLINAGFALFDAGRLEEARLRFEQSLEADPSATIAHYGLGLVGNASGNYGDARLHYQAFLRSEPPDSKWAGLARESLREMSR